MMGNQLSPPMRVYSPEWVQENACAAPEVIDREAKWARWPQGDAGDAIDFACGDATRPMLFLEDWRAGRADEWPEYMRWLNAQRDGARSALSTDKGD